MENKTIFETLSSINVNEKTEKKSGLTYLSWAWAWSEFQKVCPEATYYIVKDTRGLPYFADESGAMVYTRVTVGNIMHEMWLPVMDGANKAMKTTPYTYTTKFGEKTCEAYTMFDINKTIMRCLTKNLAMFGLGIYIYAGEDLPEGYEAPAPKKPTLDKARFNGALDSIKKGTYSIEKLEETFELSEVQRDELNKFINEKAK
jgi:hypothetical protein